MNTTHETRPLLDYMSYRTIAKELWEATRYHLQEKKISSMLAGALPLCLLVYAVVIYISQAGRFSNDAVYAASIFGLIMAGLFISITGSTSAKNIPVKRFSQSIKPLSAITFSASALFLWIWISASAQLIESGQTTYVMSKQLFFGYITLLVVKAIIACVAFPRPAPPKEQTDPKS